VDLTQPLGRELIQELATQADVLVENYRCLAHARRKYFGLWSTTRVRWVAEKALQFFAAICDIKRTAHARHRSAHATAGAEDQADHGPARLPR
jgi:hypothetical protein